MHCPTTIAACPTIMCSTLARLVATPASPIQQLAWPDTTHPTCTLGQRATHHGPCPTASVPCWAPGPRSPRLCSTTSCPGPSWHPSRSARTGRSVSACCAPRPTHSSATQASMMLPAPTACSRPVCCLRASEVLRCATALQMTLWPGPASAAPATLSCRHHCPRFPAP
ncbi:hypothetical protein FLJ31568, isoform CRA_a [Homo sapiens]|uniref:cDNA FLJ31568 fis, clone NT2RI2001595 n=1 Tax=Homo sapiens TaxID=9606 RepID=Q96N15_HUMAN|nr:hypothetical protein FLJ31568, isoform CRA_a [Homo sapiens]EAW59575.1 hypothetical protein FLJ31568, isoform CRA_a [Homo sapiens]EAW59576.1 hypothetical protein FLJ31568, isoform CRA_a [Homo sapiens]EAW59577.1 hypothetical protein FLJ31568, isoform CRA_a [Homo sapiens]BAB71099.1 unnamed protein product [Homo sapiens]